MMEQITNESYAGLIADNINFQFHCTTLPNGQLDG